MDKIKFLTGNRIRLNGTIFKGYTVGNLPPSFGYIYDEENETNGIYKFFNFKGLTYIQE